MNPSNHIFATVTPSTRRDFLKKSASAFGFTLLPAYLALGRADAQGNVPPSARVNLACIGASGRASAVIPSLCRNGNANLEFDPVRKRFKNNDQANAILDGLKPRKGWEEFYKDI